MSSADDNNLDMLMNIGEPTPIRPTPIVPHLGNLEKISMDRKALNPGFNPEQPKQRDLQQPRTEKIKEPVQNSSLGSSVMPNDSQFMKQGFQAPSYRNRQTAEKLLASHLASLENKQSLDMVQTERSNRLTKQALRKERISLLGDDSSFEDQPTVKERESKPFTARSKRQNVSSYLEQPSILDNADEAGNIELLGRILRGYYENVSYSMRRILLSLGAKIDKQREAEIRRQKALTNNVLASDDAELKAIESEISRIDRQNLLNVVLIVAVVAFIGVLLFR